MKIQDQPDGLRLIREAVHKIDASEKRISDQETVVAKQRTVLEAAELVLVKLRAEHAEVERQLAVLISAGTCAHHVESSSSTPVPVASPKNTPKVILALEDPHTPIKWRLACALLVNPTLNYATMAELLWGPVSAKVAKNRISSHLAELRRLGVVTTLGSNTFKVDRAKFAEISGLLVDEEASADRLP